MSETVLGVPWNHPFHSQNVLVWVINHMVTLVLLQLKRSKRSHKSWAFFSCKRHRTFYQRQAGLEHGLQSQKTGSKLPPGQTPRRVSTGMPTTLSETQVPRRRQEPLHLPSGLSQDRENARAPPAQGRPAVTALLLLSLLRLMLQSEVAPWNPNTRLSHGFTAVKIIDFLRTAHKRSPHTLGKLKFQ